MCAVSAIVDHYKTQFPIPYLMPPIDYWKYLQDLEEASKLDLASGNPDCSEGEKLAWRKAALEAARSNPEFEALLKKSV